MSYITIEIATNTLLLICRNNIYVCTRHPYSENFHIKLVIQFRKPYLTFYTWPNDMPFYTWRNMYG